MTAEDARKLSFKHSKRMQLIYELIEASAKKGNRELQLFTSDCNKEEMEVLKKNDFAASYESSETDGAQFVLIKW